MLRTQRQTLPASTTVWKLRERSCAPPIYSIPPPHSTRWFPQKRLSLRSISTAVLRRSDRPGKVPMTRHLAPRACRFASRQPRGLPRASWRPHAQRAPCSRETGRAKRPKCGPQGNGKSTWGGPNVPGVVAMCAWGSWHASMPAACVAARVLTRRGRPPYKRSSPRPGGARPGVAEPSGEN